MASQLPHRIKFGSAERPRTMGQQLAEKPQKVQGEARSKGVTAPKYKKPKPPKPLG